MVSIPFRAVWIVPHGRGWINNAENILFVLHRLRKWRKSLRLTVAMWNAFQAARTADLLRTLLGDGFVANAAKDARAEPIIAIGRDSTGFDGILLPYLPD
jgi:hypothetical protein